MIKGKRQFRILIKDTFFVSLLLFFVLSWFEWREPDSVSAYFCHYWIIIIPMVLSVVLSGINFFKKNSKYIFLVCFLLLAFKNHLISNTFSNHSFLKQKIDHEFFLMIFFLTIATGIFILWKERELVKRLVETNEKKSQLYYWQKNKSACTNLLAYLSLKLKKRNWIYGSAILILLLLLFLASEPLTKDFIGGDEWHMYNLAKTISETGQLETEWSFLYNEPDFHYEAETIPSLYLALWFKLFGESIHIAHLSSLSVAILFVLFSYGVIKKIFNRHISLLFLVYFATTPFFVWHSVYIRGYIYLLLLSIIVYYLLVKIALERKIKGIALLAIVIFLLTLVMKDIRDFSLVFLVPLAMILLYKTYQHYKHLISSKLKIVTMSFIVIMIFVAFVILPKIKDSLPYHGHFKENLSLSWMAMERGLFNFPPQLFIVILLSATIFSVITFKINRTFSKKMLSLVTIWISITFIYSYFPNEAKLIPRYMIPLVLLNFILLITSSYLFLLALTKNKSMAFSVCIALIALSNCLFWTTNTLNGWGSAYNYVDMYEKEMYTSPGKIKEKTEIMYNVLYNEISQKENNRVALLSEYAIDPRSKTLSPLAEKINIFNLRSFQYKSKFIQSPLENYSLSEYKDPIKKEVLERISKDYDTTFIVYQTRKAYKFKAQEGFANELGFHKISGSGINNSGVEIFAKNE